MLNSNKSHWKSIEGYEGYYEVSDNGLIRSVDRVVKHSSGTGTRPVRGKLLAINIDSKKQYQLVHLNKEGKRKAFLLHRLVAKHFIPNPDGKPEVNHIDGVKLNNNADNLEWVTSKENHQHAWQNNLYSKEVFRDKQIGTRRSKHTNYRNVSYDKSRDRWMGGVKHNKRVLHLKRFNTPEEAALHVNWIIDEYNLNRPKNVIA